MPTISRCAADDGLLGGDKWLVIRSSTGAVESTGPGPKWRAEGTIVGWLVL